MSSGGINAFYYDVSRSYTYTGYAAGYNDNDISTLECSISELDTISLNVKDTFFRTQSSELGQGHQNQLNSVYFSVPNKYINDYGKLQEIKCEWYEYKTQPIFVTSDMEMCNYMLNNWIGVNKGTSYNSNCKYSFYYGDNFLTAPTAQKLSME